MTPFYEDRSSMEADWRCGTERYWLTEYRPDGEQAAKVGGIVPAASVWDLELGAAFADGVAALVQVHQPASETALMVSTGLQAKWGVHTVNLLQGLIMGAALHVLPRLVNDYDIIAAEPEHHYRWPDDTDPRMIMMTRPDLVLTRRSDHTGWVPDWKTTSWKDEKWLLAWEMAIQMHIQAAAVQQARPGLNIQGGMVLGAYKGYVNDFTGERMSPFIWAYTATEGQKRLWSPKYVRGWDRVSVSEYPGGPIAWVEYMRSQYPTILSEQFPVSHPIFIRHDMIDRVMAERVARLTRIQAWRDGGRVMPAPDVFDHRTLHCARCPYKTACWNPPTTLTPLAHGLYVRRVPNHAIERLAWTLTPTTPNVL